MNFRAKTILGIAAIEIVLLIILVLSSMSFLGSSNEKQLIQRAKDTATMFAHATTDAVLTTNLATLDDLVAEMMTLEDVVYVRVISFGRVLSSGGSPSLLSKSFSPDEDLKSIEDGIFDTREEIISDGTSYGHIEIGFATSAINTMLNQARKSIISIASLEVVLVALFSFVLGTYLTKNLIRLRKAAHTVSKKGPGYQINLNQNDELGEVANAFDTMSRNLADSYKELQSAREEAEHANESKSRFLASMSHEIRTPMNGVLGLLTSLSNTTLDEKQKKLVETATESGNLLLSLINNILDFSRMEANNLSIDRQVFDIQNAIESVVNSFKPIAESAGLALIVRHGELPQYVLGDETRYKQILLNLIGNALKFTEQGNITIEVENHAMDGNRIELVSKIRDTGIGIKPEAIPYLFDEFTMADQSFSRSAEGSGLGLAICKRLVELMDGDIKVESVEQLGSCFTFRIPFELADEHSFNQQQSVPQTLNPLCKTSRILVAEDNKANQLVIQNLFKHIGIDITLADNGKQAVKLISENSYDIVFMDISMPVMDGLDACKIIRELENEAKANIPIIAFTAHALAGDKEKFLKAGMTDYLSKPVNLSHLINALNKYVAHETCETIQVQPEVTSKPDESRQTTSSAGTASDNDVPLVNEATLIQMVKDTSPEVMPVLINHYIEETIKHKNSILTAHNTGDYEAVKFASHTLGSSSLSLGNARLSNLARKIENRCVQQEFEQASELINGLEALTEQSLTALEKRRDQGFRHQQS